MDNQKIGNFISELRKTMGMTQKDLADKLNVTDKAVSKWERGVGYPEITLIPLLADSLGISTGELLLGERSSMDNKNESAASDLAKTDLIVADTIEYVKQAHTYKTSRINGIALTILSFTFLLAIFVCMLCNFVISRTFDWSLYPLGGEVVAWLIIFPFFALKRHRFVVSLAGLTISILPLLMLIEHLCPVKNWVFTMALPIVIISLISLWIIVLLFVYTRIKRFYLVSFVLILFGVFVNFSINKIVSSYISVPVNNISVPINAISFAFIAAVVLIIGSIKSNAKKAP
jgi:transcriptional regulator with XRE-family HTH domain